MTIRIWIGAIWRSRKNNYVSLSDDENNKMDQSASSYPHLQLQDFEIDEMNHMITEVVVELQNRT